MKLLLDECLPHPLKRLLQGHECSTVQEMGWSGKTNGQLLALAEGQFQVLITMDQGMEYEQNLIGRRLALLILCAPSNKVEDLAPVVPAALAALPSLQPGQVVEVGSVP
jgi:predicted nuclease of predicted toxin-antitoxin system